MKVGLYSIYDVKTCIFHAPHCCINKEAAKRHFANIFANPQNPYYDYCEDYRVMDIGEFSDETGKVVGREPEHVADGQQIAAEADMLRERRKHE